MGEISIGVVLSDSEILQSICLFACVFTAPRLVFLRTQIYTKHLQQPHPFLSPVPAALPILPGMGQPAGHFLESQSCSCSSLPPDRKIPKKASEDILQLYQKSLVTTAFSFRCHWRKEKCGEHMKTHSISSSMCGEVEESISLWRTPGPRL